MTLVGADFSSGVDLVPVAVIGRWIDQNGAPGTGRVLLDGAEDANDGGQLLVPPIQLAPYLDQGGQIAVSVLVPPGGLTLRVRQQISGSPPLYADAAISQTPSGARKVTDALVTAGSATLTSATAAFTGADVGAYVGTLLVPPLTSIAQVVNSTTVTLSQQANSSGSSLICVIGAVYDLSNLSNDS